MTKVSQKIKSIPAAVKSLTKRDSAKLRANEEYKEWFNMMKTKLSHSEGSVYLGGPRKPFPFNKEYIAPVHLTTSAVEDIRNSLKSKLSLIELSQKFRISKERIKAIEKLSVLKEKINQTVYNICTDELI
jgi:hypothetical protein